MKLEINLENKAKLFAQYWGQKIMRSSYWKEENKIPPLKVRLDNLTNTLFLKLKPISSITYEDAESAGISKRRLKQHIQYPYIMTPLMDQILRSKGYALPWMGLSVEEMVEAAWIKLQEA